MTDQTNLGSELFLHIEQGRLEDDSSDGKVLALALGSSRFR